jgi:hypothetical protein
VIATSPATLRDSRCDLSSIQTPDHQIPDRSAVVFPTKLPTVTLDESNRGTRIVMPGWELSIARFALLPNLFHRGGSCGVNRW